MRDHSENQARAGDGAVEVDRADFIRVVPGVDFDWPPDGPGGQSPVHELVAIDHAPVQLAGDQPRAGDEEVRAVGQVVAEVGVAVAETLAAMSREKYPQYGMTAESYAGPGPIAIRPRKAFGWTSFPKDVTRFTFG